MRGRETAKSLLVAAAVLATAAAPGTAQPLPWVVYEDSFSDSVCSVVNTVSSELVELADTGQLVIVSGTDVTLRDSLVDADGFVFFEGMPLGLIDFAEDADGFRTLWWMSLAGRVIEVDELTLEPAVSDLFPSDISNVACDACPFWDDPTVCAAPVSAPDTLLPVTLNLCGISAPLTVALTAAGLGLMGLGRRRGRTARLRETHRQTPSQSLR